MSNITQPPDDPFGANQRRPDDSGTMFPDGQWSDRTSPPPLYPTNEPLPNRVEEVDMNATSVGPAATSMSARRMAPPPLPPRRKASSWGGCLVRGLIVSLFLIVGV